MSEKETIFGAILNVQRVVGSVAKDGENKFHRYKYTSEKAVLEAVRGAMIDNGIVVVPAAVSDPEDLPTESGIFTGFTQGWTFHHVPSSTSVTTQVRAGGIDKGDKGPWKANTGSYKYVLLRTFALVSGDDPEADEEVDKRTSKKKSKSRANTVRPPSVGMPKHDDSKTNQGTPPFMTDNLPPEPPPLTDEDENSEGPPEPDDGRVRGVVEAVSEKKGENARGPWKKVSVKINETWYATFDDEARHALEESKGSTVSFLATQGKFGMDIARGSVQVEAPY